MFVSARSIKGLLILLFIILLSPESVFAGEKWRPVLPAELAMKKGVVEPDADAEIIFLEIKVADEYVQRAGLRTVLQHYIRIKILTDRGRNAYNKVDLVFGRIPSLSARVSISNIEARTTRPDGSTVLLASKDIIERDVVKGDGIKKKAKSFVVPGIETGAVVEYKWKEIRRDNLSFFVRLQLAREIPARKVKYFLKPLSMRYFNLGMRIQSFNTYTRLQEEPDGYYSITVRNVESFHREPYMPPEYSVKPWLLVYYADERNDQNVTPAVYWSNHGKATYEIHKSIYKNKKQIRAAARQAVGDAGTEMEKVRRIFAFCRGIKNLGDDALDLTDDQRKKIKRNKSESDTLKRRQGYRHDIDLLFAAMLHSAGLKVRFANVTLRTNPGFSRNLLNTYSLISELVAVHADGEWHYLDPGWQHLPFGMLRWSTIGQTVLISDQKNPMWAEIPKATPDQSRKKTKARLRLDENGTIEGAVRIEFTGHLAARYKEDLDEESDAEREKAVIAMVKGRVSDLAEVSEIVVENMGDAEKPLVYSFKIRVNGYAQRTGKRILLTPNILANRSQPLFAASERHNNVFFTYPWSEEDDVVIVLPDGYHPETEDPANTVSDSRGLSSYTSEVAFDSVRSELTYNRTFAFGANGELAFSPYAYARIKKLFDSYHSADQKRVVLKRPQPQ